MSFDVIIDTPAGRWTGESMKREKEKDSKAPFARQLTRVNLSTDEMEIWQRNRKGRPATSFAHINCPSSRGVSPFTFHGSLHSQTLGAGPLAAELLRRSHARQRLLQNRLDHSLNCY